MPWDDRKGTASLCSGHLYFRHNGCYHGDRTGKCVPVCEFVNVSSYDDRFVVCVHVLVVGCQLKEHPEHGVYVRDLSLHTVHSVGECERIMVQGWGNRSVGYTLMNKDSSRSHSIFTIHMEICNTGEITPLSVHQHTQTQSFTTCLYRCVTNTHIFSELNRN